LNDWASDDETGAPRRTGVEALQQFAREVVPLWLAHGSHPVFTSTLGETLDGDWDFVSVVRYRSRRDFAAIQTSDAFVVRALPHRMAATERNLRVKVAGNAVPLLGGMVSVVMLLACSLISLIVWRPRA